MVSSPLSKIQQTSFKAKKFPAKEVSVFLILTFLSGFVLCNFISLQPEVTDDFFFSSEDPQFQSEKLISQLFVRNDSQVIISATGDIESSKYQDKIWNLTMSLLELEGIGDVKSLTHGPKDFKDALKSPLWKRLIISDDKKSSNLIMFLDETYSEEVIPRIEKIIGEFSSGDFKLSAAGVPYVVELIRRSLLQDLKVFSTVALIVFGLIIFMIFRSKGVFLGTLIACLNACILTFILSNLLDIPIGILTANLGTIICILTLSHIIFLTYNWKKVCIAAVPTISPVDEAMRLTFPPSFWSMLTTLLGFLSLIFVEAKPLRDLGASGAIGTLMAICAAYAIFPAFLRIASPAKQKRKAQDKVKSLAWQLNAYHFLDQKQKSVILVILIICILALPGLWMIDSDPSLLAYFSKKSEIGRGFSYIDRNGGSSPLIIVVRSQSGDKLISQKTYQGLWQLQEILEQHRSVGSVISLPVLLAQAKKNPLGFILSYISWNHLIKILEQPEHEAIAKSFISEDRKYGLFMLRMTEAYRSRSRLEIVDEIKELVRAQGFRPIIVGGIYSLQGHLAQLVAISLVRGLGKLILLFAIIAWLISRSLRITLALLISVSLLPVAILGLVGLYRIPLDIISAPASNIAIAIGIDAMIHMIKAYRRLHDWRKVKDLLWEPILTAMFVIAIGFGIFSFSSFPPTQRFGLAILIGSILASLTALFILPFLIEKIRLDKIPILANRKNLPHIKQAELEFKEQTPDNTEEHLA